MYVARVIIVLCLILGILFAYSPLVQGGVNHTWQDARPDVILIMDSLYATIRNFVAGTDPQEGIHDDAPGVDFDTIITEERGVLL